MQAWPLTGSLERLKATPAPQSPPPKIPLAPQSPPKNPLFVSVTPKKPWHRRGKPPPQERPERNSRPAGAAASVMRNPRPMCGAMVVLFLHINRHTASKAKRPLESWVRLVEYLGLFDPAHNCNWRGKPRGRMGSFFQYGAWDLWRARRTGHVGIMMCARVCFGHGPNLGYAQHHQKNPSFCECARGWFSKYLVSCATTPVFFGGSAFLANPLFCWCSLLVLLLSSWLLGLLAAVPGKLPVRHT